jgi:hypothetical protein
MASASLSVGTYSIPRALLFRPMSPPATHGSCPAVADGNITNNVSMPLRLRARLWPAVVSRGRPVIAAFHPPATFSVRFVPILVSPAGEKVHAAGEKHDLCGG